MLRDVKVIWYLSCYNATTVLWVGLGYIMLDYFMIVLCSKNRSAEVMTGFWQMGNKLLEEATAFMFADCHSGGAYVVK